jgi:hypothetical protein
MKKIISTLVVACLVLASHAQMSNEVLVSMPTVKADRASIKASREFWKRFGEGKKESWYKLNAGFLAEFLEDGIKYRTVFDAKGNWIYTIKEYNEQELPKDVRELVKSTYYDYSIGWVKEVSQYQSVVYVVHIADGPAWKDVLVQDGEMRIQHSNEQ